MHDRVGGAADSAISTRKAFSTAICAVMTWRGRDAALVEMSCTAARPLSSAATRRAAFTAGIAAVPGSDMPSASAMQAMVACSSHHRAGSLR